MENKLTNEELAKVFAMYLGCPIQLEDGQISSKSTWIIADGYLMVNYNDIGDSEHICRECRMLLTPLSAITDEDAVEIAFLSGIMLRHRYVESEERQKAINIGKKVKGLSYPTREFLILKGYAVPLWFGIDHWANGKTAIELGIAIDKTKNPQP